MLKTTARNMCKIKKENNKGKGKNYNSIACTKTLR